MRFRSARRGSSALRLCWAAWRPSGQAIRAAAGERLLVLAETGCLPARFRALATSPDSVLAAYEVGDGEVADRHVALGAAERRSVRTPSE